MKGKPVLRLRPWPRIHQPSPRESQQLLSALTSSFRRQLDAADTNKPVQSAHEHMQAVLNNPLFRVVPPGLTYPQPSAESRASLRQRLTKEPMTVFDELVASGSINRDNLRDCLDAQLALIGSQSSDVKQEMQKAGAGSRVVNWFWASDPASRKLLFRSQRASRAAVKFMVAEGLHKDIAVLLEMLRNHDVGGKNGQIPEDAARRVFRLFLQDYMEADVRYGRGLSGAVSTLVDAAGLTASAPDEARFYMLGDGAVYLVNSIISHGRENMLSDVSASTFDRLCEVIDALPVPAVGSETLRLYHPSQPTAQPFLNYIRDYPGLETSSGDDKTQEWVVQAHLDAMRLLLDEEKYKDAQRLVPKLRQMFSDETTDTRKTHDTRSQMDELMGRLDVALV